MRIFCFIPSKRRKKQKALPVLRALLPPSGVTGLPGSLPCRKVPIRWSWRLIRGSTSQEETGYHRMPERRFLTGSDPDKSGRSAENHVPAVSSAGHNGRRHGKILSLPRYRKILTVPFLHRFSLSHVFKGFDQ